MIIIIVVCTVCISGFCWLFAGFFRSKLREFEWLLLNVLYLTLEASISVYARRVPVCVRLFCCCFSPLFFQFVSFRFLDGGRDMPLFPRE
jgi:hypothetical protein